MQDRRIDGDRKTVLLVERSEPVRHMMVRHLVRAGYEVVHASTGQEALALLRSHRSIDMLITDTELHTKMTGMDLALEVMARKPGLPVLYISGSGAGARANFLPHNLLDLNELERRVDALVAANPSTVTQLPLLDRKWKDPRDEREWVVRVYATSATESLSPFAELPSVVVPGMRWIVFRQNGGATNGRDLYTHPLGPDLEPASLEEEDLATLLDLARARVWYP
jgi:CheY-like chemotaxis protein